MDQPAEIATLRVTCIGELSKPKVKESTENGIQADQAITDRRSVHCFLNDRNIEHIIYDRSKLKVGNVFEGPALVEEATSVTTILPGYKCIVDRSGVLVVKRGK